MGSGDYLYIALERTAEDTPDQYGYGIFLQEKWNMFDTLSIMTALRYDNVKDIDGAISPKISLLWLPADRVGFGLRLGVVSMLRLCGNIMKRDTNTGVEFTASAIPISLRDPAPLTWRR